MKENQASNLFPSRKILSLLFFLLIQNILFFLPFSSLLFGLQILIWVCFAVMSLSNRKWLFLSLFSALFLALQLSQLVWRGSPTNHLIAFASMLFLSGLTVYTLIGKTPFVSSLLELISAPVLLVRDYFFATISSLQVLKNFSWLNKSSVVKNPAVTKQLRSLGLGLLFGLPIVYVLLAMFSSADPIFAKFLQQFSHIKIFDQVIQRGIWTLVFLVLGLPILFLSREKEFHSPLKDFRNWSLVQEMTVVMTLIALTLGLFLAVQWPYVFVHLEKETSLSTYGVATYSEYVKKGFEELLRAAVLIFSVIWVGLITWKKRTKDQRPYLLGAQLVVLAEFGVFLLSLFRRVWLYQSFHGWTLAKIYGVWLLVGLVGMVLTLAARHLWNMKWVRAEVVWLLIWLFVGSWFNAENFIIQSGHLPTVNGRKDYVYLSRMSSDGANGWVQSYDWAKEVLERQLAKQSPYDATDRQQIAYAAKVIGELTQASGALAKNQASTAELVEQYQANLSAKELELKGKQEQLNELKLIIKDRQLKMKGTNSELNDQDSSLQNELSSVQSDLEIIGQSRQVLSTQPIDWAKVSYAELSSVLPPTYDPDYLENICTQLISRTSCARLKPSFFELQMRPDDAFFLSKREQFLPKFLQTNRSEQRAYELMKEKVPYQELLRLQTVYFELRGRILLQPAEERGYEQDVSYNSPLIW